MWYAYMCVHLHCVGIYMCICVWRCEVGAKCQSQSLSPFIEVEPPNGT